MVCDHHASDFRSDNTQRWVYTQAPDLPLRRGPIPWQIISSTTVGAESEMTDQIPKSQKLPKKPLVEAIFELRWKLQQPGQGNVIDPGFQVLLGRFYDNVSSKNFCEMENLPISVVPEVMTPYVVRHRFRKTKEGWPLIQLGTGMLSVNDTESYDWETFRPMLRQAVEALLDTYPVKIAPLVLGQATLRYIDAIPLNTFGGGQGVLEFLEDHLHTNISIDPLLFDDPKIAMVPEALNLRLNFRLDKPRGLGVLSFSTGMKENVPSIIWENMVISREPDVPKTLDEFETWFVEAHAVTDRWFFTLCRGELFTSFGGKHEN
jgi:uncharacterized protein (TIGR04255 family)